MASNGRSKKKMAIINGILTVLALTLLAWTIRKNWPKLQEVWDRSPDWRLLGLALAVYVCALIVTFARWHRLVAALGLPFRFRDAIRLGFIGNVFNLVIPGAVGGDVVKAAFLCREQERKTQAVASMVVDRALGLLGLFVLAGLVGVFVWSSGSVQVRKLIAIAWGLSAIGSIGLVVLFSPALYRPVLRLLPESGRLAKVFGELIAMTSAYRERIGVIFVGLAMAMAGHALYVLTFFLANHALFGERAPGLLAHFVVVPLILLCTAVPLPFGAVGVTENWSGTLFLQVLGFDGGVVAMLGFRLVMYLAGLVSVVVYLANLGQVRALRAAANTPEVQLEPLRNS